MDLPSHLLPDQRAALARFVELLAASPHSLVSRRARAELATRHVPECVALAQLVPAAARRVLDVGSGGGLPGLVLAIVRPDLDVHLLDSTRKKTAFLAAAAGDLGVPVTVHTGRAEHLATSSLAGSFDVVTARAVAPLCRLLPWTVPFLAPAGVLYAVKGDRWPDEVSAARRALRELGARVLATPDDAPPGGRDRIDGPVPRVVIIGRGR